MICLYGIFREWNGPEGIKRKCWRDQAIKYACEESQMKAAQELLIFPFPNFFTFVTMWYLKEKNPSPTVTQKQIQTNHRKKKKNPWCDSGFTLTTVVVTFLGPQQVLFCFYIKLKGTVCHRHTSKAGGLEALQGVRAIYTTCNCAERDVTEMLLLAFKKGQCWRCISWWLLSDSSLEA